MTDRPREDDPTLNPEPGPGPGQPPRAERPPRADNDVGEAPARPERDFGDSAGYGTGGSALDYHEVGDEDASPINNKRNPLDDVMPDVE